jgi:hypothetical protein
MSRQYFREILEPIMVANQTAITGTTEAAAFPVSPWTSLAANQLRPGQTLKVTAFGIITTAASPGNLTITPRYGTTTSGTTLGASVASALTGSLTNVPWFLEFWFTCRTVGTSGTAVGAGSFQSQAQTSVTFGGTAATIDTTAASGIFIGVTMSGSASDSLTTQGVAFEFLN